MRRAFVSLPDGVWKILDSDFKGKIGEGDSEAIRNIIISYLSDKGYFMNEKGEDAIEGTQKLEEMSDRLRIMEYMIASLTEILEEKGTISLHEWENRIKKNINGSLSGKTLSRLK